MSFNNGVNYDEARYNRQNRLNPPEHPPGQEVQTAPLGNGDDIFSTSAQPVGTNSMGVDTSVFNSGLAPAGASMNSQMPQQPVQQQIDWFDKFVEGSKSAIKGLTELGESFKDTSLVILGRRTGGICSITGIVVVALGIIAGFVGYSKAMYMSAGGVLTAMVGCVLIFTTGMSSNKPKSLYKTESNSMTAEEPVSAMESYQSPSSNDDTWGDDWSTGDDFTGTDYGSDSYGDDDPDAYEDEEYEEDWDWDAEEDSVKAEEGLKPDDALNTLQQVPQGMYTRQYLYDAFSKVLPTITPSFAKEKVYDDSTDEFYDWEEKLREAAEVAGCKEEELPELEEVKTSLFIITVVCTRTKSFKADAVAAELARIYAYQDSEFDPKVYAKADTVGKNCIIKIFTGKSALISLKDMMVVEQSYVLDPTNYIPVILGVDPLGKVIKYDFKLLESVIITGMPRSGKSWFVQCVLAQMCAYVSPKELHIYICDPKEKISDFKSFCLPHVKRFEHKDEKVLETLRYLVKVEAPRRKNIIGDEDDVNIWDFKKKNPDVYLPVIYVVVDEIVTLASRMDKETNNEFRMLLRELISQLPALGIRAFLIPHVLNNDIIEKKTSDLVPLRISVCGDEQHIERVTGSKFKDFPYKLTNKGDMAVRMPAVSPNTMFVHGPAITSSNLGNRETFDYMRRVWSMLEPTEVANSVAAEASVNEEGKKALKEFNEKVSDDEEDLGLFGNSSDSSEDIMAVDATTDFLKNIF